MKNYSSVFQDQANFLQANRAKINTKVDELVEKMGLEAETVVDSVTNSDTRLLFIQIPYIHPDYSMFNGYELVSVEELPLTSLLDSDESRPKWHKTLTFTSIQDLASSLEYSEMFSREGYSYVFECVKQGLRHRVRIMTSKQNIEPDEIKAIKVIIRHPNLELRTHIVVPIFQFYSIGDIDIKLTNKIATLNISRGGALRHQRNSERNVDLFTFKFKLRKDSPNIIALLDLIENIKLSLILETACLDILTNQLCE